jgi:hypothetical protein
MANECIPLFRPGTDISATASAAVTGKRFVDWTGYFSLTTPSTLPTVAHATAAGKIAGVSAYDAASGSRVAVIRGKGSIVPVTALGAITAGVEVEVGTGGKVTTFSAGVKVGRALSAGSTDADTWIELY